MSAMFLGFMSILHMICSLLSTLWIVSLFWYLDAMCLLIFYTFPLEILEKILIMPFSVLNLLFFKYKYKERKSGDFRSLRICSVFEFAVFEFAGITVLDSMLNVFLLSNSPGNINWKCLINVLNVFQFYLRKVFRLDNEILNKIEIHLKLWRNLHWKEHKTNKNGMMFILLDVAGWLLGLMFPFSSFFAEHHVWPNISSQEDIKLNLVRQNPALCKPVYFLGSCT